MSNLTSSKIRFLNLSVLDEEEISSYLASIKKVLQHGQLILGPEVKEFEERFCSKLNAKYAVSVSSGTEALYLALKSLGIGPGDEVVTTCLSWVATANAIKMTGATPIFADIREDLNIDPESISNIISEKTKAILPVHFTGKICDMEAINSIAIKHNIFIVEDACQAFGSSHNGSFAGTFGKLGCFSLNPMKILGALGEAGIIITNDEELRDRLIMLRYNGTVNREECREVSLNGRMDTLQAAVLLKKLDLVQSIINKRTTIADYYSSHLAGLVEVPTQTPLEERSYYTYTIQTDRRDELMRYLNEHGVETKIQHPILMPNQPAFSLGQIGSFPIGDKCIQRILCIPAHEKLTASEQEKIVTLIKGFFK